jgi:hypothetical protein
MHFARPYTSYNRILPMRGYRSKNLNNSSAARLARFAPLNRLTCRAFLISTELASD